MTEPRMPNEDGVLEALNDMEIIARAREDYSSVDGYQARLLARLRRLHHFYSPLDGDQWPEDLKERPGKIHMTANLCKPAVDIDAHLQAMLPRIACRANSPSQDDRDAAAVAEKIMQTFFELSGWDVWMADFTKIKCMYGFGVLKAFWNTKEDRPDVTVVENPANLRIGWGASDFSIIDWTIYESRISPIEVMRRYPDIVITFSGDTEPNVAKRGGDPLDPLDQTLLPLDRPVFLDRPIPYQQTDYELKHVIQWDYWFKDSKGAVWNAIIIGRSEIAVLAKHPELPDIPYIVVENDHEPSLPWGIATHEHLLDINYEYNRAISHAAQMIQDEIDPSWQITGENADSVPDGLVPRAGEAIGVGANNEIKLIPKTVNFPPIIELLTQLKTDYHDISGLPSILFGYAPGSRTAGTSLAIQIGSAMNRLDFKRRRLIRGLKELIAFWAFMTVKRNPRANGQRVGDGIKGYRRWDIVPPEITPKDVLETTTNAINQVQAKIISLKTARDILGYDSPEDEEALIVEERSNVRLFPGDVQVQTSVLAALQNLQMQAQQAQAQEQAQQSQQQQAAAAQGAQSAQNQAMQPTLGPTSNTSGAQPTTLNGSPAPAGGPAPAALLESLVRPNLQTGQGTPLDQISMQQRI